MDEKKSRSMKSPRAGYRIHFDRLRDVRAATSVIRTHKYKCEIAILDAKRELSTKFSEVARVVDSSEEGSLLWFLIQLYGLGFLFVPKEADKTVLLNQLQPNASSPEIEDLKKQLNPELSSSVADHAALYDLVTKTPREVVSKIKETGQLPSGLVQAVGAIFSPGEPITLNSLKKYPIVESWVTRLKAFALERGDLKEADLQDFFGLKLSRANSDGTTFVVQSIPLDEVRQNQAGKTDIYKAYFKYLLPAADVVGRPVKSIMGVSDNQNAFPIYLENLLSRFKEV